MDIARCNTLCMVSSGLAGGLSLLGLRLYSAQTDPGTGACVQYGIDDPLRPKSCDTLLGSLDLRPTPASFYAEERKDNVCYRDGPGDFELQVPASAYDPVISHNPNMTFSNASGFVTPTMVIRSFMIALLTVLPAIACLPPATIWSWTTHLLRLNACAIVVLVVIYLYREVCTLRMGIAAKEIAQATPDRTMDDFFERFKEFDAAIQASNEASRQKALQDLEEQREITKAEIMKCMQRLEAEQDTMKESLNKRLTSVEAHRPELEKRIEKVHDFYKSHHYGVGFQIRDLQNKQNALQARTDENLAIAEKTQEAFQNRTDEHSDITKKTHEALQARIDEQLISLQKTHEAQLATFERKLSALAKQCEEQQALIKELSQAPSAAPSTAAPPEPDRLQALFKGLCDKFTPSNLWAEEYKADMAKLGDSASAEQYLDAFVWYLARSYNSTITDGRWQKKILETLVFEPTTGGGFQPPTSVRGIKPASESLRLLVGQFGEDLNDMGVRLGGNIRVANQTISNVSATLAQFLSGRPGGAAMPSGAWSPMPFPPALPPPMPAPRPDGPPVFATPSPQPSAPPTPTPSTASASSSKEEPLKGPNGPGNNRSASGKRGGKKR